MLSPSFEPITSLKLPWSVGTLENDHVSGGVDDLRLAVFLVQVERDPQRRGREIENVGAGRADDDRV